MAVVGRQRAICFTKDQMLADADLHMGVAAGAVLSDVGRRRHHASIEARNAFRRSKRNVELDIRDAQRDRIEALGRRVTSDTIAPRASRLDKRIVFLEIKAGAVETLAQPSQSHQQRLAIGDDDSDVTAHHLGLARRQMKLAASDVHPHIADAGHQVGIARQPESDHIEERRELLIGDGDVDVLELDDIAEVLCGPVEWTIHVR